MDLAERGLLTGGDDVRNPQAEVGLTLWGLMAARELSPRVGKPAGRPAEQVAAIAKKRYHSLADADNSGALLPGRRRPVGRNVAIVAHGLTKEAAVPRADIDRALARKRAFEADPERHTYRE